jgi:GNAT superfamily N-acetyltransferase
MQSDEIEISVAEEKDAKELTNLYRKLYAGDEEQEFFKSEADQSYFKAGSKVFVARLQGKIIGFVWAVFYERIKNKGVGIIEELFVEEGYRRRGIGRALVNAALNYLREHSFAAFVTTSPDMEDAQNFYKAIGFRESKVWYFYDFRQEHSSKRF